MTGGEDRKAMSTNTDDRWLSRRELADRFGLPINTLAQWASKGTGPRYVRMGRHARYRLSDVIDWETNRFHNQLGDRARPSTCRSHELEPVADANISDADLDSGVNQQ